MWRGVWEIAKEVARGVVRDDVTTKAAALALYSALGLAPLVLLLVAVTSWLGPGAEDAVIARIESLVGNQPAKGIADVVKSTKHEQRREPPSTLPALAGLAILLFSASGIFTQLQTSLNQILGAKPSPRGSVWEFLRARLFSVRTLLSIFFLLLATLVVGAGIAMAFGRSGQLLHFLNFAVSLVVYMALFALVFRLLPDARMRWRDLWVGAAFTAVMFAAGNYLIGLYLSYVAVASRYGAAGSLVALIVWLYYSAIIVFVGAEVTRAYACRYGAGVAPRA